MFQIRLADVASAEPFEVSKSYVQKIFDETASPRMEAILKGWETDNWDSADRRQRLAYNIMTECLAYQSVALIAPGPPDTRRFASPVRWIETQDVLFSIAKFERFVEVGPSPVLAGEYKQ